MYSVAQTCHKSNSLNRESWNTIRLAQKSKPWESIAVASYNAKLLYPINYFSCPNWSDISFFLISPPRFWLYCDLFPTRWLPLSSSCRPPVVEKDLVWRKTLCVITIYPWWSVSLLSLRHLILTFLSPAIVKVIKEIKTVYWFGYLALAGRESFLFSFNPFFGLRFVRQGALISQNTSWKLQTLRSVFSLKLPLDIVTKIDF